MLCGCSISEAKDISATEKAVKAVDGDTVMIDPSWNPYKGLTWKIRVLGIDTPEKGYLAKCEKEKMLAKKATLFTQKQLEESHFNIKLSSIDHDKYGGRFVAYIQLENGMFLGEELIKNGYAKKYTGSGPKPKWC